MYDHNNIIFINLVQQFHNKVVHCENNRCSCEEFKWMGVDEPLNLYVDIEYVYGL